MSQKRLYRLGSLALILGGTLATTAHALHLEEPPDPAQLAHYAHLSQPIHLLLFAGGLLVLLGTSPRSIGLAFGNFHQETPAIDAIMSSRMMNAVHARGLISDSTRPDSPEEDFISMRRLSRSESTSEAFW